jgi:exosortase/archaeosortase family protein
VLSKSEGELHHEPDGSGAQRSRRGGGVAGGGLLAGLAMVRGPRADGSDEPWCVLALLAALAVPLIQLSGFTVTVEGTLLNWGGKLVEIDAPCSGIRLLWTGIFLSSLLAAANRWRPARTFLYGMAAVAAVVSANVMRAAALFYIEAGDLPFPPWAHSAVGLVVFAWMAFWGLRAAGGLREKTV